MKKIFLISTMVIAIVVTAVLTSGCATQRDLSAQKSGAELWAQNCIRCHNIPSPDSFNDEDWETIGLHMKVRANMTSEQIGKIIEFMKTAN